MTGRCATLPIALLTKFCDTELIAERYGLTPIAVRPVAFFAAVSAAIDKVAASLIDVTGSTLLVDGYSYTDRKKEAYWTSRLAQEGNSPPSVWRSMSTILGRNRDTRCYRSHSRGVRCVFYPKS